MLYLNFRVEEKEEKSNTAEKSSTSGFNQVFDESSVRTVWLLFSLSDGFLLRIVKMKLKRV